MKVLTLKSSGNRSIYQLENQHHDIDIKFASGKHYAVLVPSYYNVKPTTHSTIELAAAQARKLARLDYLNVTILDSDGHEVTEDYRYL